ncbi:MAG: membrane dipeptidase [Armatimonadia bacterium]
MNDQVQKCWDVALAMLKPTQAQLEHGLELHRASVVCDTYGFAPNAALDGDALAKAMEEGASDAEIADMREDMGMTRWATVPQEREEFKAAFDFAGVTCIYQNAGEEGQDPLRLIKRLARFTYSTDLMRDFVARAATPDDILAAHKEGRHCLYFTGNGVPLTQHWVSPEEEMRYIRIFFQLGIRMMHLTYNRRNMIGDGCAEPANGGLSDFGRKVIAEMNRQGVLVDCAHSGWQTSLEAAQTSTKPMVASHSACAALQHHHRGKPDNVIRAIADTGGYIGICAVPAFLGGRGTIVDFIDHIDYVKRNYGADYVGIGTDTSYVPARQSEEWKKLPSRGPQRKRWCNFWWENDPLHDPKWQKEEQHQSLGWTNWPLFTVGMVQRGYSDEDIQKIIGGNMLRVARAVL